MEIVEKYRFRLIGRGSPQLRDRTKEYSLRIIRLYDALPSKGASRVIGNQLLRSGTSVGAQYREACRGKSEADFVSKIQGSLQELEESLYWIELLVDADILKSEKLNPLMIETEELIKIFVSIVTKLKSNHTSISTKGRDVE